MTEKDLSYKIRMQKDSINSLERRNRELSSNIENLNEQFIESQYNILTVYNNMQKEMLVSSKKTSYLAFLTTYIDYRINRQNEREDIISVFNEIKTLLDKEGVINPKGGNWFK